jgi:hypothetical protein
VAIKTMTCYIAVCDICGDEYPDGEYGAYHYDNPSDAVDAATLWPPDGAFIRHSDRIICRRADEEHATAAEAHASTLLDGR